MKIGDVIKQARIQKGYTQEELAELVGVQKSAVAKWENGRVSEIKRSNLYGLAQALGISPTSLVGDSESDKKEKPTAADDGLSPKQKEVMELLMRLSPSDLDRAVSYLKFLANN